MKPIKTVNILNIELYPDTDISKPILIVPAALEVIHTDNSKAIYNHGFYVKDLKEMFPTVNFEKIFEILAKLKDGKGK